MIKELLVFIRLSKKDKRLGSAQGKRHYDLPLNKNIGTGFLIVLIALMTFLVVIAIITSFALESMTNHWSSGLENKVTIEIPAEKNNGSLRTNDEIKALQNKSEEKLKTLYYIKTTKSLSDLDIQDLLSPWLGKNVSLNNIPLPGLISIDLHTNTPEIIQNLKKEMSNINADIKIDTHEAWLGDLLKLAGALQFAAITIALIITITTVTAIAGSIRTRMAVHSEEVELLHLIGAHDSYITRQLQRHAVIIAFKGSLCGLLTALVTLMLIKLLSGEITEVLLPEFQLNAFHALILIAIPALACLIAAMAARFTVLRTLAIMP